MCVCVWVEFPNRWQTTINNSAAIRLFLEHCFSSFCISYIQLQIFPDRYVQKYGLKNDRDFVHICDTFLFFCDRRCSVVQIVIILIKIGFSRNNIYKWPLHGLLSDENNTSMLYTIRITIFTVRIIFKKTAASCVLITDVLISYKMQRTFHSAKFVW